MAKESKLTGSWGEALAAEYLRKKKYQLVSCNYSCRYGEIDLIVKNKRYIVFVEVKLRKTDSFANASDFVDYHKQNRIRTTAELWLTQHDTELQPRFDVVEIYAPQGRQTEKPKINHLEDAFQ